ncbi:hypothetical protein IQ22_03588 [Pseudomonas duriflava]|uniref:UPF0125 protein IQ22_03588 n=1 Tax=Pseudomonas duriflava TaxID=459528 RepID=A0A562Q6T9_9PSED|nr:RnfH family protein [Pseudomonas duriflava]TWI52443.1 hypothetical protein IQ22_03588 [Pseudomonas duriflava]
MAELVTIEVVLALPERQELIALEVPAGTTVREAVYRSGMAGRFPELAVETFPVGIFGKRVADPEGQKVEAGDRIELYRPLIIDPKDARKRRAESAKAKREL